MIDGQHATQIIAAILKDQRTTEALQLEANLGTGQHSAYLHALRVIDSLAYTFADHAEANNPEFNRGDFLVACGRPTDCPAPNRGQTCPTCEKTNSTFLCSINGGLYYRCDNCQREFYG